MRTPRRGLAAVLSAAVVATTLPALAALGTAGTAHAADPGQMRITEWMYDETEFIEFTNVGDTAVDMSNYTFSDTQRTVPPAANGWFRLTEFGIVAPGESVVLTDMSEPAFRGDWQLDPSVKVVDYNPIGLSRDDEINLYDQGTLVDRLTFNDENGQGPRTNVASAWLPASALGQNVASKALLSEPDDDQGSWTYTSGVGQLHASPGVYEEVDPPADNEPDDGIRINEVESNGDAVDDWVELTNSGDAAVDIGGWLLRDGGNNNPSLMIPDGTTIEPGGFYATYTDSSALFGLGGADSITLSRANGTAADTYSWGAHATTTYGRCPDGTGDFTPTALPSRGAANICSPVRLNEVWVSADGKDIVELTNISDTAVDLEDWVAMDSTDVDATDLAGVVQPHDYYAITIDATLDSVDSLRLFDETGVLVDSTQWTSTPDPSLARCPDGVGAFTTTKFFTYGSANDCGTEPWPGSAGVQVTDLAGTFDGDASGVAFDPNDAHTLWVVRNGTGRLFKMAKQADGTWAFAKDWEGGKALRQADGSGVPDAEGVVVGPDGAVYVSSESNLDVSNVSKNAVLRYDVSAATGENTELAATDEWDLNGLLPPLGANKGLEGLTWVPDTLLDFNLYEDSHDQDNNPVLYQPGNYPGHGSGLFVGAAEGSGKLYFFALARHTDVDPQSALRVATVDPKLTTASNDPHLADVFFDAEQGKLWAVCDNDCDGKTALLTLQDHEFVVEHAYKRPPGMPNINNEGFAIAPASGCDDGVREVVWADDDGTDGHALRSGTFPCAEAPDLKDASVNVSSDDLVTYGSDAQLGIKVTGDGVSQPSGTVTVSEGLTILQAVSLSNDGSPTTVHLPTTPLGAGTHELTVTYSGDAIYQEATVTYSLTVGQASPSVQSTDVAVAFGQEASIPVEVEIPGTEVAPTGTVTVLSGVTPLAIETLSDSGAATVKLPPGLLGVGDHTLTVAYSGDDNVEPGTYEITLTVTQATPTITATGGSIVNGQEASIPVLVTVSGVTPTGSVAVKLGDTTLASAKLSGGGAVVKLPAGSLAVGTHTLSVAYSGDDNVKSGSATTTLTVIAQTATTTQASVTATGGSVVYGQSATVSVTVTASAATPTGAVTVLAGGPPLGTATLTAGAAKVTIPAKSLAPGVHQLTVTYSGDAQVTTTSGTIGLTVTRAAATVEKPTVKPKRVVVKKTKARVLVKVVAAGLTPSGKVTITGRGVRTKTATLRADGTVVVKLAKFKKRGARTLTVGYSGDAYVEASSTTFKVRVKKPKAS